MIQTDKIIFFDFDLTLTTWCTTGIYRIDKPAYPISNDINSDKDRVINFLEFLNNNGIKYYIITRGRIDNVKKHLPMVSRRQIYGSFSDDHIHNPYKIIELYEKYDIEINKTVIQMMLDDNLTKNKIRNVWAYFKCDIICKIIKDNNYDKSKVLFLDDTPVNVNIATIEYNISSVLIKPFKIEKYFIGNVQTTISHAMKFLNIKERKIKNNKLYL